MRGPGNDSHPASACAGSRAVGRMTVHGDAEARRLWRRRPIDRRPDMEESTMPNTPDDQTPEPEGQPPSPDTRRGRVKGYCPVCMGPMPPCKNNRCTNPPEET